MSNLFPGETFYRLTPFDNEGYQRGAHLTFEQCHRCGSLVLDRDQHTAWHGSVDTATTTELRKVASILNRLPEEDEDGTR